jgi:hypothetical protein
LQHVDHALAQPLFHPRREAEGKFRHAIHLSSAGRH